MPAACNPTPGFELKSTAITLVALILKTTDLTALAQELDARLSSSPDLFEREPVALDLSWVRDEPEPIDFDALLTLLRERQMLPIAAKGGSPQQMQAALAAGLIEGQDTVSRPRPQAVAPEPQPEPEPPVEATPPQPGRNALVVDKPLRSGQRVYARGGDLIVLAMVSYGAEVIADGNIHVYAPLRGRALAGARGDATARILSTCMEPQLLSIAGIYRTTETELAPDVLGKAAQVWLDGERLVVEALKY